MKTKKETWTFRLLKPLRRLIFKFIFGTTPEDYNQKLINIFTAMIDENDIRFEAVRILLEDHENRILDLKTDKQLSKEEFLN